MTQEHQLKPPQTHTNPTHLALPPGVSTQGHQSSLLCISPFKDKLATRRHVYFHGFFFSSSSNPLKVYGRSREDRGWLKGCPLQHASPTPSNSIVAPPPPKRLPGTPQQPLESLKWLSRNTQRGVYSSVVEHPAAIRQVPGSNPGMPCFFFGRPR